MASSSSVPIGFFDGILSRSWLNEMSASGTTLTGVPGFFKLRFPPAGVMPQGSAGARSFYDTSPLRETLLGTDQDDAVPMRGERCSQGEACDVGFDLRTRVSVVGIAKFNANSTA